MNLCRGLINSMKLHQNQYISFLFAKEQISPPKKSILKLFRWSLGVKLCAQTWFPKPNFEQRNSTNFHQPKKVTKNQRNNQFRTKPERCIVSRIEIISSISCCVNGAVLNKHKYNIQMRSGYQINVCFTFVTAND